MWVLKLYKQCQKYNLLPEKDFDVGSQRWDIMFLFDIIDGEIALYEHDKIEENKKKKGRK